MHETGGSWYPATVTAYVPKGQPTPWRVAFDYDDGGAGAVLLDDELHSVRRAPKKAPDPKKAEPEPEPRGFDDFMAELTVEPAVEGAGSSAEMAELRRQLRVAHEESKRHEKARSDAEERAAWARKQQKNAERWSAQMSHDRWAPRVGPLGAGPPERVVRSDLRASKFSDEDALAYRSRQDKVHWQVSKQVWARLTWPNTGSSLRPLSMGTIMERLHADEPGVQQAGGRPWLLFPTYERRAELFWKHRATGAECEVAGEQPAFSRPIARRMLLTVAGAQSAIGELWPGMKNGVALGRAFRAACGLSDMVEWRDFGSLLRATIFFQEMWARLEEITDRDDATLTPHDFRAACALMGQRLSENDCLVEYGRLRAQEKGCVYFISFCEWLARCHIYTDADKLEPIPWATSFELELELEIASNMARQDGKKAAKIKAAEDKKAAEIQKDLDLQEALTAEGTGKDPEARAITLLFGPLWVSITNGPQWDIHGTASVDRVIKGVLDDPFIDALLMEGERFIIE